MKFDFEKDVLQFLLDATSSNSRFEPYLKELNSKGILDDDSAVSVPSVAV